MLKTAHLLFLVPVITILLLRTNPESMTNGVDAVVVATVVVRAVVVGTGVIKGGFKKYLDPS